MQKEDITEKKHTDREQKGINRVSENIDKEESWVTFHHQGIC